MAWLSKSKDHLPLTWWNRTPIYLAAVLALVGVGSMIVTALLMAAHMPLLEYLVFTHAGLLDHGRVWTVLSYALVNPPSIWVVVSSVMLWRFGEDVEKFFGRRVFVKLIVALWLAEPLMLSLCALGGERGWPAVGIFFIEFGVFIAFATLYPRAKLSIIICSIDVWVLAAVLVGVNALQALASHDWESLVLLATQVTLAFSFVRIEQGRWTLPSPLASWRRWRARRHSAARLRVVRDGAPGDVSALGVDAILEKISRQGMQSLTPKERRALEKASEDLQQGAP